MEQKIVSIIDVDVLEMFEQNIYKTLIKRWIFDDPDKSTIRLSCDRTFSLFWKIIMVFAVKSLIHG